MSRVFLFIIIGCIFLFSCKDDNINAGAKGTIEFGEGSCMPPIDFSSRIYLSYTGMAYFIETVYLDSLSSGISLDQLKASSDSAEVANGKFVLALEPGTYSIFLKEPHYSAVYDNNITVYLDKVTEQDYKFWHCTSY